MSKILHIFNFEEKFSKPFFQFLQDNNFDLNQHCLFHYGKTNPEYETFNFKYTFARYYSVVKHLKLFINMFQAKKIIVHSLASPWLLLFLSISPSLKKKIYWVLWGKDLYFYKLLHKKYLHHKIYEFFRKKVIKDIKHVVTYVPGDVLLAKKWYGMEAEHHECLMYPSNLFKNLTAKESTSQNMNILLGNSADPSNNHKELFEKITPFKSRINKIFLPLSYGNRKHAMKTIQLGKQMFGQNLSPLTDFMPFEDYMALISNIDIAIFAHNRQQAMGNIITLLGLGKKVYLKESTTSFQLFKILGIHVFTTSSISLEPLTSGQKYHNIEAVKSFFSAENLKLQLQQLFQ